MLNAALSFLRTSLNAYLQAGADPDSSQEDIVRFIAGDNLDPIQFPSGAVSLLLINLEEENQLRAPDPYRQLDATGAIQQVQPDIRLNLYLLFVSRFRQYEECLHYLSLIIRYFQSHRSFNNQNSPNLPVGIERLVMELTTLPFAEQNEVWSALRTTYMPSVVYRCRMIVFQDEDPIEAPTMTEEVLRINQS